ncbi:kinesin-II 85 kDa subunit-like [Sycon ciliatum]|uniref:kinesin-II 85 kDa subunit-like n=1 Tax=Sycon ciliatum TaxID=27933 RepID=UPI0020A94BFF|eukprot:scpid32825/ scgid2389/ Kinesin-related protein 1; Kinesin family member 1; Kinesin-3
MASGGTHQATASNVQVAIRCRPFNDAEKAQGSTRVIKMSGQKVTIHNPAPGGSGQHKDKEFFYDYCYFWDAKTDAIYDSLGAPLLNKALDGYNATIFAYGQTGSGKTYGMSGTPAEPGIIPTMNSQLFERIESSPPNVEFLVTVSYLEIYQEVVYDLLNPHGKDMKIRQHPKLGVYVDGLAELVVRSSEDIARLQEQGNRVRRMASTEMNKTSSRSHSVFTVVVQQKETDLDDGQSRGHRAKINLVDLAGSERADRTKAEGQTLKEGAFINKSLAALGNVINALAMPKKGAHIPYRDSKLTRILQESLGGNCLTVMLAMVSPADVNFSETVSTLEFANRAKNIQNKSHKNEDENATLIRSLREEIAALRNKLQSADAGQGSEEVSKMEEMVRSLQLAKQQTWEERERLSMVFEEDRRKNLANKGILEWVMDSVKKENREVQAKMAQLQKERDQLSAEYKHYKKVTDDMRVELQTKIDQYSDVAKSGDKQGDVPKQHMDEIHQLKERFKVANDRLKESKGSLQTVRQQLATAKEDAKAHSSFLAGNAELRQLIQKEEMDKLRSENATTLKEAMEHMRMDIEQEKADLQVRFAEGAEVNTDRMMKLEVKAVELKAEHDVLGMQMEQLESEKQKLQRDLEDAYKRHNDELEIQKLKHFQTFRAYRLVFDDQKKVLEQRYRKLLEDSIQDAVYLSARNTELSLENERLRKELADSRSV